MPRAGAGLEDLEEPAAALTRTRSSLSKGRWMWARPLRLLPRLPLMAAEEGGPLLKRWRTARADGSATQRAREARARSAEKAGWVRFA